ncbi:MAG: alternative ribosome rescue factor ArfA [Patescibacteria group bacterium]|nr:alternative ribosome rescue factor ArfA [Patescibacteria group bacterium]
MKNKHIIKLPDQLEILKKVRKNPVPTSQQHEPKKGKGSYKRKPKHKRLNE